MSTNNGGGIRRKTAIVTGATSGLGLACVGALLDRDPDCHVVLAVRDPERGRAAVAQVGRPGRCTIMALDLASLDSVRRFATEYAAAGLPPLRALICNAGVQVVSGTRYTTEGVELTFGVNHLGHFALVQALRDRLEPPARVVVVSSGTHDPDVHTGMPAPRYESAEALAHPHEERDESPIRAGGRRYSTSKLCNVLFAYELDRRLGHGKNGVTVNAFDPGLMPGSGLARDYDGLRSAIWRFLLPVLRVLPQVRGVRASGRDLAALAVDFKYGELTGQYFVALKRAASSAESHDRSKAIDLWQTSERLVKAHADGATPSADTGPLAI